MKCLYPISISGWPKVRSDCYCRTVVESGVPTTSLVVPCVRESSSQPTHRSSQPCVRACMFLCLPTKKIQIRSQEHLQRNCWPNLTLKNSSSLQLCRLEFWARHQFDQEHLNLAFWTLLNHFLFAIWCKIYMVRSQFSSFCFLAAIWCKGIDLLFVGLVGWIKGQNRVAGVGLVWNQLRSGTKLQRNRRYYFIITQFARNYQKHITVLQW